jgi:fatty acid desaturase
MYKNAALLAGSVAVLITLLFLGWMIVSVNALPLWIVGLVTLGMIVFDFYQAMKEENADNRESSNQNQG